VFLPWNEDSQSTIPQEGTPVKTFLQRFGGIVLGVLSGFDRLVFKGKLRQLYSPNGMNCYLSANRVLRKEFKAHAKSITDQVLQASLVAHAQERKCFRYLNSSQISKEAVAREIAEERGVKEGLACVLQCVEPCWTFDLKSQEGRLTVQGQMGKCSQLYHYYLHPQFGWIHVRLQTWFPFEMQVYLNGREWLARQMDAAGLSYRRSDNKFLWVSDWPRAQELFSQQLQTSWPELLDDLQQQVHPLHPGHLGKLPLSYNWTVFASEWATDVAFRSREDLEGLYTRWVRHAFLNYDSMHVLRFLGQSGRLRENGSVKVQSNVERFYEGVRLKHWVNKNSLKLYDHVNVLRPETTINQPRGFKVFRTKENDPDGEQSWRILRRNVADLYRRAEVSEATNERYLEALAGVAETKTVKDLAAPLCRRTAAPGSSGRQVRALNPLETTDAALLTAISDPKWMINGIRNKDLVAVLYANATTDAKEKRRRSARVTRLIRILRAHGLLHKVAKTHRYQVGTEARTTILALLAAHGANPEKLTSAA
jgi:hypothetical protein